MKKVWCRTERTYLGIHYPRKWRYASRYKQTPPKRRRRWKCPDCGRRFKICTRLNEDRDIMSWGPPHKKRAK